MTGPLLSAGDLAFLCWLFVFLIAVACIASAIPPLLSLIFDRKGARRG